MKWLSAGLTFVNVATLAALLLGSAFAGLGKGTAWTAILLGSIAAVLAFITTRGMPEDSLAAERGDGTPPPCAAWKYRHFWLWMLVACFAFFAFRSFCWLIFIDGSEYKIQSPNNLGDIALHIAYIKNFASGVPLWPANPIYVVGNLRYPAGTDLFNSLLLLAGVDLIRGFVWTALLASVATCYALYRWSGSFGIAGFLFNGGLAGFELIQTWKWMDYQGGETIAWKNLALSMFVTQRGVLYALPVGLLLLYHWRAKYFPGDVPSSRPGVTRRDDHVAGSGGPLPFWIELTLYASMPLFHVHTFMALSIVAAFFFSIGNSRTRRQLATIVGAAFIPATFFIWTITDHFHARSVMAWNPGWVQKGGEMAMPFIPFWIQNFGILLPLAIVVTAVCIYRAWKSDARFDLKAHPALAFLTAGAVIFLFACLVKTAPWEWDNIKLLLWAYLILLPFLWSELITRWPVPVRVGVCVMLFSSGFVSLFGGLATGKPGFGFADRAEVDGVGAAVRKLPVEVRFASYPTYNHPLLLQGRRVVIGYPAHVWTQGFTYHDVERQLEAVMNGEPDWREQARALGARYLFWGRHESGFYKASTRVWEREALPVASGGWGTIYDLEAPTSRRRTSQ